VPSRRERAGDGVHGRLRDASIGRAQCRHLRQCEGHAFGRHAGSLRKGLKADLAVFYKGPSVKIYGVRRVRPMMKDGMAVQEESMKGTVNESNGREALLCFINLEPVGSRSFVSRHLKHASLYGISQVSTGGCR
jgi:hypothetical protein